MKKKLIFVNPLCYYDTDKTVLRYLSKEYDVTWYPITHRTSVENYSVAELLEYAQMYNIECIPCIFNTRMRSLKNFSIYYKLVFSIRNANADVVYTSTIILYWHIFASLLLNKKIVIQGIHDVEIHSGVKSGLLFSVINMFRFKAYKYFVTYSKNQQELLLGKYKKKSYCVGMSKKNFGQSLLYPPLIEKEIRVLFFGGISRYKGIDLLIETFEKLCVDVDNHKIHLSICGHGEFWNQCKQQIRTRQLYNLQIRFIDNQEIPDLMCSHHFLILPYRDVTNSGPMMIALNYNLPIIAPKIGCFNDVYTEENAVLYAPDKLYQALISVNEMKNSEYLSMKKSCCELSAKYTEEEIAERYINFFRSVVNENVNI